MEENKMAKTWTVNEAYNAIKTNDSEGIADFGKRFPLATTALAKAGQNAGLDVLFGAMPDRVTMRILEMQLKDGVTVSEDDEEVTEEVVEEKPAKTEKKAKADKAAKTEKKAAPKKEKAAKKVEEPEEDEEEETAEEETVDYKSMGAVDLFKLCKKRGIKVEPKQKSNVYIKALEDADKAANADTDEDDDWGDDEDEAPKKSAKGGKAKKAAKTDDEDDEWDI